MMNAMTTLNHIRARPAQILIALISSLLITTFLFAQTPVAPTVPTTDVTASEPAKASEPAPAGLPLPRLFNYTLGFALINSPTYLGASDTRFKVRPFFAVQYGRFSIADSRATAITDFGVGASYALLDQPTWKASVGLRVDNGRKSGDSANLAGLPDIERTLRGRVSATWTPIPRWALSASTQTDLLGRKGGTVLSLGASHTVPIDERQRLSFSAGTSFGDATYMNSYFGVDNKSALASGRTAFVPGMGIRDAGVGASHNFRISHRWFLMSSVGASRLLGDAGKSPTTLKKNQVTASISVAYQCCK
jgi:MipA family protein